MSIAAIIRSFPADADPGEVAKAAGCTRRYVTKLRYMDRDLDKWREYYKRSSADWRKRNPDAARQGNADRYARRRAEELKRKVKPPLAPWTDEMKTELCLRIQAGQTYSLIAERMAVTRGAVCYQASGLKRKGML
jgi:hypothetical protein